ncbi:hypothetical protein BT96DRAFT_887754 [Gymnopus androsaceus JB14]|uniref:Uncharacterized protein n=1 Tax=Gymnopus androsaceus JB14 TaxID=1447944 RepID=A0A6A4H5X9_9AGAR|nr:hypothetical protein BT96DRAFT_887754 [Gymnopus androsaceus JB14]
MGCIISCITGIFACIGEAIMAVIGCIAGALECIVAAITSFIVGLVDCLTCGCCSSRRTAATY